MLSGLKRFLRTRSVPDLGPVGWIIMSLSALFFKFSQLYWCVNISKRKETSHTAQMNKELKDIQPKGRPNPAGPGVCELLEQAALIRKNKTMNSRGITFDTAIEWNTTQKVRVTYNRLLFQSRIYISTIPLIKKWETHDYISRIGIRILCLQTQKIFHE